MQDTRKSSPENESSPEPNDPKKTVSNFENNSSDPSKGEYRDNDINVMNDPAPESLSLIEEADNEDDTMSQAMSSAVGS